MKKIAVWLMTWMLVLLSACQAEVCPPDSIQYVADPSHLATLAPPAEGKVLPAKELVQIGKQMIEVDRVIHGSICNDTWSGTIYVACDIRIVEWDRDGPPNFLDGCELIVEEGTVVYVAAHNNAPYFKGCTSCHTSEKTGD
jgi:hypothetical protein